MKASTSTIDSRWPLILGVAIATAMIAQQLAGKAIRDAFFLSHFGASALPTAMMVASTLSIISVLGTARIYRVVAPARLVPWVFFGSAAWFLAEWALSLHFPRIAAASLYIHTTSFGAVVVSGFWSVVNERFDPHTAKRVIAQIAGGATIGGMLGGLAAWQGSNHLSVTAMILALGAVNLLCGILMYLFGRGVHDAVAASTASKPAPSVLAIMEETPYLWQLAFLVATSALAAAAFDYVFKARAAAAFANSEDLVSFFSLFYLGLGIGTFIFQQLFAGPSLRWLGLTATVATMPVAVIAFGLFALVVGGLTSVVMLRAAAAITESSLYRSGYELLYTPLAPEKKRPTKTMIDVGGDKLGAAIGGGLSLVVVQTVPGAAEPILLSLAVGCGCLALITASLLQSGYVRALADSLRTGRVSSSELNLDDRVSRKTAEETKILSRDSLGPQFMAPTTAVRTTRAEAPQPTTLPPQVLSTLDVPIADNSDILKALAALRSQDTERIRKVLQWYPRLPADIVPAVVMIVKNDELRPELMAALKRVAPQHIGLFTDILLSANRSLEARRAVPELLGHVAIQRSVDALIAGLRADRLELRFRCAVRLQQLRLNHRRLIIPSDAVLSAVIDSLSDAQSGHFGAPPSQGALLGMAFIALSSILPPIALRDALEAVAQDNPGRRGTGLEYIENILPASAWTAVEHLLYAQKTVQAATKPALELIEDVRRAESSDHVDIDRLITDLRAIKRDHRDTA